MVRIHSGVPTLESTTYEFSCRVVVSRSKHSVLGPDRYDNSDKAKDRAVLETGTPPSDSLFSVTPPPELVKYALRSAAPVSRRPAPTTSSTSQQAPTPPASQRVPIRSKKTTSDRSLRDQRLAALISRPTS